MAYQPSPSPPIKVAVAQFEPAYLDLSASVTKTCTLIQQASASGAKLVAFPECWIPGYPAWIWARPVDFNLSAAYMKNSLKLDSAEMREICATAATCKIAVVLGFSENYNDSLYIAQAIIGADGAVKLSRRKLKATHMERTIFGDASGSSLENVVDLPGVGRVGALACWEHTQPLLKYHTYHQNESIHVAAWPPVYEHDGGPGLFSMSSQGCHALSQAYAIESQSFVLHATAVLSSKAITLLQTSNGVTMNVPGGGSSAIFGPDGRMLAQGPEGTEEAFVYAELHPDEILKAKGFLDVCGHYSRPDLLWLGVDEREKRGVVSG
ncbi:aliphatic nitrilase [Pyrenophora seminiperda CCB06]|uniref:nitrilase n=1 Tax=Pyrenophora seminiperda CCB06 TaxID=1302712 RepID=A0A3M7MF55_9PLEO|nr:aliphatic nitrilase [Pyrenophora seminiperda CCB06]